MTATTSTPWHAGERRLQAHLGVEARMAEFGPRVIRDHMPDQHRDFFARLPFVVLGSVDEAGDPWATLLTGAPGFLTSPEPRRLNLTHAPVPADPAWAGLRAGAGVGLLGIELHTRRRNRMNGTVVDPVDGGFGIAVAQSFGNCPRYIRHRDTRLAVDPAGGPAGAEAEWLAGLDAEAHRRIAGADTFFVASYVDDPSTGQRQVDVSHRGGEPGFVRVGSDGVLTIPDFAGNLHFNTLGNLLENPRAGLVFLDFASGELLQLTGTTEVILDGPEIAEFQGAERLWTFRPQRIVRRRQALPVRFVDGEPSAHS